MLPPSIPSPESLHLHGPRLRALALELVGDAHTAEDLVQETWLEALEPPPPEDRPLRRWLNTVLRNLAFEGQRAGQRRAAREAAVARHESTDSPSAANARFVLHRQLVEAIENLREPYAKAQPACAPVDDQIPDRAKELEQAPAPDSTPCWSPTKTVDPPAWRVSTRPFPERSPFAFASLAMLARCSREGCLRGTDGPAGPTGAG